MKERSQERFQRSSLKEIEGVLRTQHACRFVQDLGIPVMGTWTLPVVLPGCCLGGAGDWWVQAGADGV